LAVNYVDLLRTITVYNCIFGVFCYQVSSPVKTEIAKIYWFGSMNMPTPKIECPFCGREVKVVYFGGGYVAFRRDSVIYNSSRLLQDDQRVRLTKCKIDE